MNRRTFLSTAALLGATGCTGLNSDNDSSLPANQMTETAIGATGQSGSQPLPHPEPDAPEWKARFVEYDSDFEEDTVGIQIESISQANALRLEEGTVVGARTGYKWLLIKIRTTNRTDSLAPRPKPSSFTLGSPWGDEVYIVGEHDNDSPVVEFPWPGDVYRTPPPAKPGESLTGWLVFMIGENKSREWLYYRDSRSEGKIAVWEFQLDQDSLPKFHVHDIEPAASNGNGETVALQITVENLGYTPALLHKRYTISVGQNRLSDKGDLVEEFEPGETKTITEEVWVKSGEEFTFHLESVTAEQLTAPPTSRQFGDSFITRSGAAVTVSSPTLTDSVVLSGGEADSRRDSTVDETFAVFEISVRNPTQQSVAEIEHNWFQVQVGEFESKPRYFDATGLSKPIEGEYYNSRRFNRLWADEEQSGVVHCSVPAETSLENLTVRASFPMRPFANERCKWSTTP
ncbi:hypothetical protein [Salinigranum halophilum]|uniref:hypothetical protein n=1 Tax=Salinigranum halophilum TaxID=2565931 RepID=UPI00115ED7DA|nr:hypothetical protein [Salinigranum halophilum]